jgi:hypothetical protein
VTRGIMNNFGNVKQLPASSFADNEGMRGELMTQTEQSAKRTLFAAYLFLYKDQEIYARHNRQQQLKTFFFLQHLILFFFNLHYLLSITLN